MTDKIVEMGARYAPSYSAIFDLMYAFLLASIILTLMPGPDILYVLTESLASGRKYGIAIACGLVSGLIWHIGLTASGVGMIITRHQHILQVINLIGVTYLLYLAYQAYLSSPKSLSADNLFQSHNKESLSSLYIRGITMNVLNPKVTIFFLAFLPGFIPSSSTQPIRDILLLGIMFMTQALVIFIGVTFLADYLRILMKGDIFNKWIYWLRILVLVGIAIILLVQ